MADPGPTTGGGLLDSLRRLLDSVLGLVQRRLEVIALDLQAEKTRALDLLVRAAAVIVLGVLALVAATATVVVALWDTSPVLVLTVVSVLYAAGATVLALGIQRRLRDGPRPFADTIEEFRKDRECFGKRS
jgi:uncharacterized membrane protein YqjE